MSSAFLESTLSLSWVRIYNCTIKSAAAHKSSTSASLKRCHGRCMYTAGPVYVRNMQALEEGLVAKLQQTAPW